MSQEFIPFIQAVGRGEKLKHGLTVILTSGTLLFLTKQVSSVAEGVALAQETIAGGAAHQKLQAWQQITA